MSQEKGIKEYIGNCHFRNKTYLGRYFDGLCLSNGAKRNEEGTSYFS